MPPAAVTRRALVGLVLIGALALGIGGVASAQEPPPTSGVLVPGTTTPSVTTPPSSTSQAPAAEDEADEDSLLDLDANEKVWVIVGGLVAIAIVMMVLTVIYWRHTKPERPKQDRRIDRAERRAEKAERKDEKRQRKAASRDPFVDDDTDLDALIDEVDDEKDEPDEADGEDEDPLPEGPLDLEGLLGAPDSSRSVFGVPSEADEPPR